MLQSIAFCFLAIVLRPSPLKYTKTAKSCSSSHSNRIINHSLFKCDRSQALFFSVWLLSVHNVGIIETEWWPLATAGERGYNEGEEHLWEGEDNGQRVCHSDVMAACALISTMSAFKSAISDECSQYDACEMWPCSIVWHIVFGSSMCIRTSPAVNA